MKTCTLVTIKRSETVRETSEARESYLSPFPRFSSLA